MSTAEIARAPALTEENTSKFVQTKKWKLHYNEAGEGHPVIMLHGTGPGATGWSNFNGNIHALSKKYRVILLDFPGWGQSDEHDPTQESRVLTNPEAVKLLMDELGIEKAALVGNSMGGMATLYFGALYPERMSHLITMGSGIFTGGPMILSPGVMSEGMRIIKQTYEDPTPENFRRLVNVMCYDDSYVTDDLVQQRSKTALANPNHLKNWLKAAPGTPGMRMPDLDLIGRLSQNTAPALLMHGRDDRVVSPEGSMRANAVLKNSQLLVFNRCGHWAQVEHAKTFNALVDMFLSLDHGGEKGAKQGWGG